MRSAVGNNADGPHGRRSSVADPRPRLLRGLDARALKNLGLAALAWFFLIAIALTGWFVVVVPLSREILDNDLTLVYIGARIGIEHGWSHIYSLPLQHELFTQLRPHGDFNDGARFISPPPYAWLIAPLTLLGAAGAVYAWLAISLAALVGAWWIGAPGARIEKGLWLLGTLAWYPVAYGLSLVQPELAVVFIVAVAWRLTESGRPYLAGVVLGLSVIKPQLTLLLPLVLLLAGRWKVAVSWAATAGAFALVSVAVIGGQGFHDYRALLDEAQHVANNRYFTLAYVLGPGALGYVAQAIVVVAAAIGAYANRGASNARIYALGIVATTLGATYWHLQDFTVLVLAAWLWRREAMSRWHWALLAFVAVSAEFAWPLTPLPLLAGVTVWFVAIAMPRRKPATA